MNLTEALQRIANRLQDIDFAAESYIDFHDLRIVIDDNWQLPLDMSARNRRALKERAQLASFGHKDKTIKDLEVRNTWEIPASRLTVEGEKWNGALQKGLGELARRLGLFPDDTIELHLHNLLLYEKGQFFARHQDTEKMPDMQASLVVILPGSYTGGELQVERKGEVKSFAHDHWHRQEALAILFYADCHHEVKAVKTGHRLALTYNVSIRQKKRPQGKRISDLTKPIMQYFSAQAGEKLRKQGRGKEPLVVLLDHQYTQKNLSWTTLKGRDRETVAEFLANKELCGLEFALALVDVQETRDAYGDSDGTWGYDEDWDSEEEEDEEELDDEDDFAPRKAKGHSSRSGSRRKIKVTRRESVEIGDLISSEYDVQHYLDESGKAGKTFDIPIFEHNVIGLVENSDWKAFESQ